MTCRTRVRPSAAGVLAVAASLALGCVAPPAPTVPPSGAAPPTGTASLEQSAPPDISGWTLQGVGDQAASVQLAAVTRGTRDFVVVGSSGQAGEIPIAYSSPDGRTWTQETIGGRLTTPTRLVNLGERVLALGGGSSDRCAHPSELDTWIRDASGTWAEAPFDPVLCGARSAGSVVSFAGRLWLVGTGSSDVPILMESNDGLTWANHAERLGDVFPQIAVTDETGLVVLSRAFDGSAVVQRSTDAKRFATEPLQLVEGIKPEFIDAVGVLRVRLWVAIDNRVRLLTSDNSGGWTVDLVSGIPARGIVSIRSMADQYVAIGAEEDTGHPFMWASPDGKSWRPILLPEVVRFGSSTPDLAASKELNLAVLVGQVLAPDGSGAVGALWTAPLTILTK